VTNIEKDLECTKNHRIRPKRGKKIKINIKARVDRPNIIS
jgi:hypothetical protein